MLSPKQEKFCLEYAKCGNERQAYIKAGYKHTTDASTDAAASRLLRNVRVQKRLQEIAEEVKNNSIADITEMQEILTQIIRQKFEEECFVVEGKGEGITVAAKKKKTAAAKDIINAINTLGKMQGAFVEKVEQNVDMDLNIKINYGEDGGDE